MYMNSFNPNTIFHPQPGFLSSCAFYPTSADQIHSQIGQIKGLSFQFDNFATHLSGLIGKKSDKSINGEFKGMFNEIETKISALIQNIQSFYIQIDNRIKAIE